MSYYISSQFHSGRQISNVFFSETKNTPNKRWCNNICRSIGYFAFFHLDGFYDVMLLRLPWCHYKEMETWCFGNDLLFHLHCFRHVSILYELGITKNIKQQIWILFGEQQFIDKRRIFPSRVVFYKRKMIMQYIYIVDWPPNLRQQRSRSLHCEIILALMAHLTGKQVHELMPPRVVGGNKHGPFRTQMNQNF